MFTLEEANRLIPELEKRLNTLQEKRMACTRRHDLLLMHELLDAAEGERTAGDDPLSALEEDIRGLEAEVHGLEGDLAAIQAFGCIVRSVELGWIDFMGCIGGRIIYYSWKKGEREVTFYRENGDKQGIRHPLPASRD